MNKIDLKNSLDKLYFQSLQSSNLSCITAVDSIKSILGINLQDINIELINWLEGYIDIYPSKKINFKQPDSFPDAISFYNLEKSLLNKDYSKSIENILFLSHVSEGTQIFEFLIEFSLARSIKNFKYIWHIYRMNSFLNNKYLKYGLIKSIELIIDDFEKNTYNADVNIFNWIEYLSLNHTNEILLYYSIYNTKLIRSCKINRIIVSRLEKYKKSSSKKINRLNYSEEQIELGRLWISHYLKHKKHGDIIYDDVVFFNNIRAALKVCINEDEKKYIWTHLNFYLNK